MELSLRSVDIDMNFKKIKNIIHLDTVSVIALNHQEDSRVSRLT